MNHPAQPQLCSRCAIDSSVPGVSFNPAGVCSYCNIHTTLEQDWPRGEPGAARLQTMIQTLRQAGARHRYDCIVGVSGGTDSIFLLQWAKANQLRPLAVHFDNGWDSEIAVNNIKKALAALQVDLQTYVVDWEEFKDILRSYLYASLPWADAPTDIGITSSLYRTAAAEGVRYVLVGNNFRSEGKMPSEWTHSDGRTLRHVQRTFGSARIRSFPNLTLTRFAWYTLVRRIRILRPLNLMEYSKTQARTNLEQQLGWQYYGGHHYESLYTRFVYSYLLPAKFKIDKRKITLSAQVRSGELTRQQALDQLAEPPYPPDKVRDDIAYVLKKLDLSQEQFDQILATPPKSFRDYPSYYPLFERFAPLLKIAFQIAFSWTPPTLREIEQRRKRR